MLLDKAPKKLLYEVDCEGNTPLHVAADWDNVDIAILLCLAAYNSELPPTEISVFTQM